MTNFSASAPRMDDGEVEAERNALTPEERKRANRDLAALDMESITETDELIEIAKARLARELEAIPVHEKEAYLQAMQECPAYATSDDFLLLFLRADQFDASAAAKRICKYWTYKLRVFGPARAFGPVTLSSLTEPERDLWLRFCINGGGQLLPGTDKAGRTCVFIDRRVRAPENTPSTIENFRVRWYLMHVAVERVSAQRNGIVLAVDTPERFVVNDFDRKRTVEMISFMKNVFPMRITAYRHIIRSKSAKIVMPFVFKALGPYLRARTKVYWYESAEDATDDLITTGFTLPRLPRCIGGTYTPDYDAWCQERQLAEQRPRLLAEDEEEDDDDEPVFAARNGNEGNGGEAIVGVSNSTQFISTDDENDSEPQSGC